MTKPNLIADEPGDIRALIRALRAREAVLRARILAARPNAPLEGADWVVTLRDSTSRRIDAAALPPAIQADPRYWREVRTRTVVARPAAQTTAQTGAEADVVIVE